MSKKTKICIMVIIFIIGMLFCITTKKQQLYEPFNNNNCHNLLIKKDNEIHLLNTNKAKIPGVNPIIFKNLEDYAEFVDWQQHMNIKCPALYFEETYNTQNEKGLRMLNDPFEPKAGLASNIVRKAPTQLLMDSNRDDPPYNQNQYSGIDVHDQYIGVQTPLDKITSNAFEHSSAMNTKWKGVKESNKIVKSGKFSNRIRKIKHPAEESILMPYSNKSYNSLKK